jgi:hypothetical protein
MSYKAKSKAIITIKAKATQSATSEVTVVAIEGGGNTPGTPTTGGSMVAVEGASFAADTDLSSQLAQNGTSSFAKAQVIAAAGEAVGNNSFLNGLLGSDQSGAQPAGFGSPTPTPISSYDQDNLSQLDASLSDDPADIAFSDEDSKAQYVILQREGLNVLRSEIIATMEYIPIASSSENNSNYNQQDDNSEHQEIKIRNISKIMELHRQIREYMLAAASKVYEKTFSSYDKIIKQQEYASSILPIIEIAVKSWFENGITAFDTLISLTENAQEADNTIDAVVTTIIETSINQNGSLKSLFDKIDFTSGEANTLFFRGIIEFFVYKFFTSEIISAYLFIDSAKETPLREWQISTSGVRKINIADIMSPGFNDLGPMYYKSLLRDNNIFDYYENNLGIISSPGTPDTNLLYQTLMLMYSQLGLRDSVKSLDNVGMLTQNEKEFNGTSFKIGYTNDLRDAFKDLTQLTIYDFISTLGTGTAYTRLGNFGSDGINLAADNFRNIGSQIDRSDPYLCVSEMLTAYAFDFCVNLNSARRIGLSTPGADSDSLLFSSFGDLSYNEYRKKVLLGSFSSSSTQSLGLDENQDSINVDTSAFFEKQISGPIILGNQTSGQSYQDFYNDKGVEIYESGLNASDPSFKPGAEHVFDNLILPQIIESYTNNQGQIANQGVKDNIETTFGKYKENSINFLSDLGSAIFIDYNQADSFNGTLSKHKPIGKMSPKHRIKNLLTYLAEDIGNIIESPVRAVPLLAVFLSQGGLKTSGSKFKEIQLKSFLAMFWGFIDSSLYSKLVNLQESSIFEERRLILSDLISGLSHYYNEELIQFFLEDRLDFTIHDCLERRGYHGGKYAYTRKIQNAAEIITGVSEGDGFNPAGFDKTFSVFLTDGHDSTGYPVYPANKVSTVGSLRSGTEDLPDSVTLGNKYNMRGNLNRCFTRSGTFLHDAVYGRDIANSNDRNSLGLYRLFEKSFSSIAADLDFSNFLGDDVNYTELGLTTSIEDAIRIFTFTNPSDSSLPNWSDSDSDYKASLGPLKLKLHHKAFVWYKWVLGLINESGLQMRIEVTDQNDGTFKIHYNKSQLRGIRDGLLEAADKISSSNQIIDLKNEIGEDNVYKRSKKNVIGKISTLAGLIEKREKSAATLATLFTNHASNIVNTYKNNTQLIPGGLITGLALTPLLAEVQGNTLAFNNLSNDESENKQIISKWITSGVALINQKSLTSITDTVNKYFSFDTNKYLLTTKGITYNNNKIKFMNKVLTTPGYGFLGSERQGLKTIINVGIPAGLVNILQKNAFQETGNTLFLNSNYICIAVHKKNHLNVNDFYDPKIFVFDTGANILDINPATKEVSSHLQNFSEEASLTNILSDIEISRVNYVSTNLPAHQNYIINKASDDSKTDFNSVKGQKVLMNHAISYALKEYSRLTTGIDMSEECFVLNLGQPNTTLNGSINVDQSKEALFQHVLQTLNNAYPQINEDQQLRNEVFRLTNVIKQMPPFSNKQNYIKAISPRKFDKVYTIIVNEKDFTIKDNPDIFAQLTNKNIGSEIEINSDVSQEKLNDYISLREGNNAANASNSDTQTNSTTESQTDYEEVVSEGLGDIFVNRDASINKQINGYIRSLNENAPEVYNYSVSVSLLPSNFLD